MTYVMIPNTGNIEQLVSESLSPFDENLTVEPYKNYLTAPDIERMAKCYRVDGRNLIELTKHLKDWTGEEGGLDFQGLFSVTQVNPHGQWDWYEIGGRWKGHIPGNTANAGGLAARLSKLLPDALVTPDGKWLQRETTTFKSWDDYHVNRKSDRQWRDQVRRRLRIWRDHHVVAVDCHC